MLSIGTILGGGEASPKNSMLAYDLRDRVADLTQNMLDEESYPISSSILERAYLHAVGKSDKSIDEETGIESNTNLKTEEDPKVVFFAQKLRSLFDDRYPINRIGEVLGEIREHEQNIEAFLNFVDNLNTTDLSKQLLRDMIDNNSSADFFVEIVNINSFQKSQLIKFQVSFIGPNGNRGDLTGSLLSAFYRLYIDWKKTPIRILLDRRI